ncbi:MAG: ATP-binding cassette domain-containing protein [Chitinophagaceae bacterium]|nr:ATP-binding cassette domain-containing protein [Chitinophagaceae bacterium]
MAQPFLQLRDVSVQRNNKQILDHLNLTMHENEQWIITGLSGSGKTVLAQAIAGRQHFTGKIIFNGDPDYRPHIILVEQQHRFRNLYNTSDFYYQQRFNASDANDSQTVAETLRLDEQEQTKLNSGIMVQELPSLLRIQHILHEPLIQLSNGENKRLQIARALLSNPQLLILDNPYLGLDIDGRKILSQIINELSQAGIHILLITSVTEIPDCITHIATLEKGKLTAVTRDKESFALHIKSQNERSINTALLHNINQPRKNDFDYAVRMVNVNIRYGEKWILKDINWAARRGEHWCITGPNGAGKSTLLSLISGDNNQAYANEIYLFDKRRGSGESIWDIKRKIGYVSPEMHVHFNYSSTCYETIASGLFDTIGLFRSLNTEQEMIVEKWISNFNLEPVKHKLLSALSSGEQRQVLLARALIKNPPLLILDEPCQGLDPEQIMRFKQMINDICAQFQTTLLYVSHFKEDIPECITHFLRIENGEAFTTDRAGNTT